MRTNTTALIANWTMTGTVDLDGSFASVVDIDALVAELDRETDEETAAETRAPLLLKPAGEDEWHTLAGAADSA